MALIISGNSKQILHKSVFYLSKFVCNFFVTSFLLNVFETFWQKKLYNKIIRYRSRYYRSIRLQFEKKKNNKKLFKN